MIKAILFDLDNTLTDFMKMKRACIEASINAMISAGLKIKKEKARKILFEIYGKHGIEYGLVFQEFMKKTVGKVDYKVLVHGINAYRKMAKHYIVPYPHVIQTLKILKKHYKLAIISDAPRIKAWERLVAMGIDKYFGVVITAADVRKQKTTTVPFNAALKSLKIKPEEAIMVGDRPERDIKTAKKLGIKTIFARYGDPSVKDSGADYEINSFDEISDILKRNY